MWYMNGSFIFKYIQICIIASNKSLNGILKQKAVLGFYQCGSVYFNVSKYM